MAARRRVDAALSRSRRDAGRAAGVTEVDVLGFDADDGQGPNAYDQLPAGLFLGEAKRSEGWRGELLVGAHLRAPDAGAEVEPERVRGEYRSPGEQRGEHRTSWLLRERDRLEAD